MNNCEFFEYFCINVNHHDVDDCVRKMKKYFTYVLPNKTNLYCCPKCLVGVQTSFSDFIEIHEYHLEEFISKTKLVIGEDYIDQHLQGGLGKRKGSPTARTSKVYKPSSIVNIKKDLNGTHIILSSDMSDEMSPNIRVPDNMLKVFKKIVSELVSSKVQFGLIAQFTKNDGELKSWYLSNKAVVSSEDFINDGILKLKEKIENYTELSSGWRINMIEEVNMKITKTKDIIHISGSQYIKTPTGLFNTQSVVNVQNKDNLCFLYSILSVIHYNDIRNHRTRARKYLPFMNELKYKPEWFPMKLSDIHKFEQLNPILAINVFQYNKD